MALMAYHVTDVNAKTPLYVGVLSPMSDYWFGKYGPLFDLIFQTAFEEVANRTDLLTDYELRIVSKNTQVCSIRNYFARILQISISCNNFLKHQMLKIPYLFSNG